MTDDLPSPAAPADLAIVREFVNTTDYETQTDDLTTPAELTDYLYTAQLMPRRSPARAADLDLARRLRRGLRRALELNHDGTTDVIPELASALAELPVAMTWSGDRVRLAATASGVRAGLTEIVLAMHRAVADGSWGRLKICASDECEWAYYDKSKNQSRNWCEYGCGNKIKMRAYRERQRTARS